MSRQQVDRRPQVRELGVDPETDDSFQGLPVLFSYNNLRAQPANTCGQAVIASILDFTGRNPYAMRRSLRSPVDGQLHFEPDALVGAVVQDHGPNWPIPKQGITLRRTMTNALTAYEIPFHERLSPPFTSGRSARVSLTEFVASTARPVIVLLDVQRLGLGRRLTLHWAMVYAVSPDAVRIASWDKRYEVRWDAFMRSWRCWFVGYPYNYYQIQIL